MSAIVPGVASGFSLATAGINLAWADITMPDKVSITAGAEPGDDLAHFLKFLEFTGQDLVNQLVTLKDNIDSVFGAEVPFLSDGVTQLVDFVNAIQTKVIDPLTGGGSTAQVPSIQALVRDLATSLGIAPDQLGLTYDKATKELTYHLVLSQESSTRPRHWAPASTWQAGWRTSSSAPTPR